jgi:hypothetical protein
MSIRLDPAQHHQVNRTQLKCWTNAEEAVDVLDRLLPDRLIVRLSGTGRSDPAPR